MTASDGMLLTIAGTDSSGGAGIQADLETFVAFRQRARACISCVTSQSAHRVNAIFPLPVDVFRQQLDGLAAPLAVKIGMLYSPDLVQAASEYLTSIPMVPVVVDPLLSASSGARLLDASAEESFKELLLPLASVVTPNFDEAGFLSGIHVNSPESAAQAAVTIAERYGVDCVLTGGHSASEELYDTVHSKGMTEYKFSQRINGVTARGTGCRYSSAIVCGLAAGQSLSAAAQGAGRFVRAYIQSLSRG